jgi:voltage-gated potassium channel
MDSAWHRTGAAGGRFSHSWPLILTIGLVGLSALAVGGAENYLAAVVIVSIAALVAFFRWFFRSSRAFCLTLANLAGVYACIFLFFAESGFHQASFAALSLGFVMPLFAFMAGSSWHRGAIAHVTASGRMRDQRHLIHFLSWLAPVFAIGMLTSLIPARIMAGLEDWVLLVAMTGISVVVLFVSRDVAVFLLDTGLLFEAFFARIATLVVPTFAFLTCYSLLVILFASTYSVLDRLSGGMNFRIDGVVRAISFPESLYFSLTTLSTVGYGDIAPASNPLRLLTAAEIVCGILLLLFGFNEIFSFARAHDKRAPPTP